LDHRLRAERDRSRRSGYARRAQVAAAGSHIARIDVESGEARVIVPPTADQGARRVGADSKGRIRVSYWNTRQLGACDPATGTWREWKLPGSAPHTYAVWVDPGDKVWVSAWSANAIVRFDPAAGTLASCPSDRACAPLRQMLGRAVRARPAARRRNPLPPGWSHSKPTVQGLPLRAD
jgi:streptogramin lyase